MPTGILPAKTAHAILKRYPNAPKNIAVITSLYEADRVKLTRDLNTVTDEFSHLNNKKNLNTRELKQITYLASKGVRLDNMLNELIREMNILDSTFRMIHSYLENGWGDKGKTRVVAFPSMGKIDV